MKNIFFLMTFIFFTACKPASKDVVSANINGYLAQLEVSINPGLDLGELETGTDAKEVTVTIKNVTQADITGLSLTLPDGQSFLKFYASTEGARKSPGAGGSCSPTLKSQASCTFKISFNPSKPGKYAFPLLFNYTNYIQASSKTVNITALVGEAADLTYTNGLTSYNFGSQEQTDSTNRTLAMEIINNGDLTARNMVVSLVNNEAGSAYKILSNNCPVNLAGKKKCQLTLAYSPQNTGAGDSAATYTGNMTLDYYKNPANLLGKLNSTFSFSSTRLEANFTPASVTSLNFPTVTAGNKVLREFSVKNIGYRPGTLKSLSIGGSTLCTKAASGNLLSCKTGGVQSTLVTFPFIIEDTNSCMGRNVASGNTPANGESCLFKVTFWPSSTLSAGAFFTASDIFLDYDSNWKNVPGTNLSKKVATILSTTVAAVGVLSFDHVELTPPGLTKLPDITPDPGPFFSANLGAIKMFQSVVDTAATFYQVRIILKNTGGSTVKVKNISDSATIPFNLIPGVSGSVSAGYYLNLSQSSCDSVAANSSCIITFNLAPKPEASTFIEDGKMFDHVDAMMPSENYKEFNYTYTNGSFIDDSGAALLDKHISIRLRSSLIKNGLLIIDTPASVKYTGIAGQTSSSVITLRNIGTGSLKIPSSLNNTYNPPVGSGTDWTWRIVDNVGNSDDCGIYSGAEKVLASNQTCTLKVVAELPETARITNLSFPVEYQRSFVNQNEMNSITSQAIDINFRYYPDALSTVISETSNAIKLSSIFYSEANIVPMKPLPNSSAILYRAPISYTAKSVVYPQSVNLAGGTVPATYFDSYSYPYVMSGSTPVAAQACPGVVSSMTYENCFNKLANTTKIISHFESISSTVMPRVGGEYILHGGTYPVGSEVSFNLSFYNSGVKAATGVLMTEESSPGSPITMSFNYSTVLASGVSTPQAKFNFRPTASGIFSRCYSLTYNSSLNNRVTRVCVYAEAVDPDYISGQNKFIKIAYSNDLSTYTDITSGINSIDDSQFASFFVVNGSGLVLKKRFKITNNRNTAINKLSYYLMDAATSTPRNYTGNVASPYVSLLDTTTSPAINLTTPLETTPACTLGMTLPAAGSCVVDIKYAPTDVEGLRRFYLGVIYETAADQFNYNTAALSFRSAPPSSLALVNTTFADPITPAPTDIYSFNHSSGVRTLKTNSYALSLNKDPANPKKFPYVLTSADISNTFEFRIINASTLKTSFLPAWKALNPAATFPVSGENIVIYTGETATITANRACFFGDDEGDSTIAQDFKGFYRDSQNVCRMKLAFAGYRTYSGATCTAQSMGGTISNSCNPFSYSMVYSTTEGTSLVNSDFFVHMQGYIEPNRTLSDIFQLDDVTAKSSGSVRIAVPVLSPNHQNRGDIETGMICYDKDYQKLKSEYLFNLINDYSISGGALVKTSSTVDIENCVGFSANDSYVNIAGLTPGSYYFFKVLSLRKFSDGVQADLNYISVSSVQTLTVVVPPIGQVYNHDTKQLIDTKVKSTIGTRPVAMSVCENDFSVLDVIGVKYKAYKKLINTSVFNYLIDTPEANEGYPADGPGIVTHWLSDGAYDISSSISLYHGESVPGFINYNMANMDGSDANYKAIYHQSCNNNSDCRFLYKLVGGDPGEGFYYEGVFYTTPDAATAAIRCYREVLCPTNPQISITSGSCLQP